jgi:Tfp pilus assembly protein PilZ
MFLETEDALRVGTRLRLRFCLPGGETLHELEGRVAWMMAGGRAAGGAPAPSPGMGIEFTDPVGASKLARELEHEPTDEDSCS